MLKSGIVCLSSLHEFAEQDTYADAVLGKSAQGRTFGKRVRAVCRQIPETPGFYAWARFDHGDLWKTIYVGKVGYGKVTSLKARIQEELLEERVLFWADRHPDAVGRGLECYGPGGDGVRNGVTREREAFLINHFVRAVLKSGAMYIVWISTPGIGTNGIVRLVEACLIKAMKPEANKQRAVPENTLLNDNLQTWLREVKRVMKAKIKMIKPLARFEF